MWLFYMFAEGAGREALAQEKRKGRAASPNQG